MRWITILFWIILPAGCAGTGSQVVYDHIDELSSDMVSVLQEHPEVTTVAVTPVKGVDPELARWFAREIESGLVNQKNLAILDRQNMDELLAEQNLMLSDLFEEETREKVGRLLGTDALVIAEIQPTPDRKTYSLRSRVIVMDSGRVIGSSRASLDADQLDFRPPDDGSSSGGFFPTVGNVLWAVVKIPLTPVTMFTDIFETAYVREQGVSTRINHSYPSRCFKGLWEGVPLPTPWVGGIFGNQLYLTGAMWDT